MSRHRILLLVLLLLFTACDQDDPAGPLGPDAPPQAAQPLASESAADDGGTPAGTATVTTDKADYLPGDTVHISGSGFWAGEVVTITLTEDLYTHDIAPWDVTADDQGAFTTTYVVEEHDVGVTFTLTATGLSSGLTAQTTFTDGRLVSSFTLDGGASVSVAPNAPVTFAVNVTITTGAGNQSWMSTAVYIRPDPAAPPPLSTVPTHCDEANVVINGAAGSSHSTSFPVNAPSTVGTYDVFVRAYNTDGCPTGVSGSNTAFRNNGIIVVASANNPPDLTDPSDVTEAWGNQISFTAAATDPDGDDLVFSLGGTPPAGAGIGSASGVFDWTPSMSQIGLHTIQVCVTDDASPPATDCETFDVTVTKRATSLVYDGSTSGQYSDDASLSATLTDGGGGAMDGDGISGKTVGFTLGSQSTSGTTNASGQASDDLQLLQTAGAYTVSSSFAEDDYYLSSSDSDAFTIGVEDASVAYDASNPSGVMVASPGGSSPAFTLKLKVQETSPEPDPNDGARAGDIGMAGVSVQLQPVGTGSSYTGSCVGQGVMGSGYSAYQEFWCSFAAGVAVNTYVVAVNVNVTGYYTGSAEDALTVYDPTLGFATGGGTIDLYGDRVSFGFNFRKNKKSQIGNIVVIRHHADGSRCRAKSNTIGAPAISGTTATFSGKANYSCVDAYGNSLSGAGNLTLYGYVQDNGEPGTGMDKFWVREYGELLMPKPAASNAKILTGGNIQVPH